MGNSHASQWSTTASNNTTLGGVSVAENCAMANLNNGERAIAAGTTGALTYVATSGTDTYTATIAPAIDAYVSNFKYCVFFGTANTSTTPTLNLNSLGAKTITDGAGNAVLAGALNGPHDLEYDGTNFRVLNSNRNIAQIVSTETGAVATGTTTIPNDDTIPQNTEGDQYMSLSVTPKNANSKLVIDVVWIGSNFTSDTAMVAALFQDSAADALAVGVSSEFGQASMIFIAFRHVMTAGTTSSTTFKVRAGAVLSGTTTFNGTNGARRFGGTCASSITITEVLQ